MKAYLQKRFFSSFLTRGLQLHSVPRFHFGSTINRQEPEESGEEFSESDLEEVEDKERVKGDFVLAEDLEDFAERRFIDRVKMKVTGGKGGDGAFTFYRDRVVKSGAPDGGDGGNGGNVIFKATSFFTDLRHIRRPTIEGNRGRNGGRLKRMGKHGKDLHYSVPIGTLIWELKPVEKYTGEKFENDSPEIQKGREIKYTAIKKKLIADLDTEGKEVIVAKGGKGGRGNAMHRGLKEAEKGKPGEVVNILLELKSLADIGLVGYPNAGKSTILATLTRAFAKIAPYPFTTLQPTVGKIKFVDDFTMTIADIPGLIEGSHQNKGLGHEFLRHIERTKVLMYVLDITSENLLEEYNVLKKELDMYNKEIFDKKPSILVLNKIDLVENSEQIIQDLQSKVDIKVLGMSAKYSRELDKIVVNLRKIVEERRRIEKEETEKLQQEAKSF